MTDPESPKPAATETARGVTTAPTEGNAPRKVAKIRCLDQVRALGFTFTKGKVVPGVSFELAKLLKEDGKAEILDVTTL